MEFESLYHNVDGYSSRALDLSWRLDEYFRDLIEDNPDLNALQLCGLVMNALSSAHAHVSINRRLA